MRRARRPGPLPDREDRRRATTLFDRNLVVTAGAGTGKTALLVERALNLIGRGLAGASSLALITFTDKAAAELRERLALGLDGLRSLAARAAGPEPLDERQDADRSYGWLREAGGEDPPAIRARALAALRDLDAASVSTIHSFCAEILRRYPREAGVDPFFRVDEGPASARVFAEERERFLAEELGPRAGRPDIWRRALRRPGALALVQDLGWDLASFAFPAGSLDPEAPASRTPAGLLEGLARSAGAAVRDVLTRASGFAPTMERFLSSAGTLLAAFTDGGRDAMAAAGPPFTLEEFVERDLPGPGKRLAGAAPEEVRSAARRAHDLVRALVRVDDETIADLVRAAQPLARRCRERLLREGQVTFDGLLRLTRDLLARHPEIRRALSSRYRTILVDEFQDTDPLQYEILFFIAETAGPPVDDAYRARLDPGRLFIVGDPKQSIYRFRGADMEAYRRAVERLLACGGEELTLTASFRSPAAIVEPVNALFDGWIGPQGPEEAAYEPRYVPIASAREAVTDEGPRVEIWSVGSPGNAAAHRRGEAEAIAAWIAANLRRTDATGSPLACKDVAILLRALTNAGLYAQALRRAGLPFVVEGGKEFYDRPEVGDLIAFLSAAANPNDAAAVLAVLRSPLGGTPDAELARFAGAGGRLDLVDAGAVDPAPFPNVRRTLALLAAFRERMPGRAPDDIIRAALRETPLALLHAAAYEGPQRLANLRKLVALAEPLARQGLSLEQTLRSIEEEFKGERAEGESPLADETVDAVRLLSVHKAKGLEYPVVFVPDLGREAKESGLNLTEAAWVRRDGEAFLAVRLADGTTNAAWVLHREATRLHEAAEEKRVFYVACTRARERLILLNSSPGRKAPWRDALARIGYALDEAGGFPEDGPLLEGRVVHRRVEPRLPEAVPPARSVDGRWREAAARFAAVAEAARASAAPPVRWPAGSRETLLAAADDRAERAGRPRRRTGTTVDRDVLRRAGTAVHAALERWDFQNGELLRRLAREEALRGARLEEPDATSARDLGGAVAAEALRIVEGFLASPLPARLAGEEILGREVPILFRDEGGTTWIGACDLVYRDREGRVVAADYKTDRVEGDPRRAAEPYRQQLAVYREALGRALPASKVRAEVLFVRSGIAVAIDA